MLVQCQIARRHVGRGAERGAGSTCMTRRQGELSFSSGTDDASSTSALSDAGGAVSRLLGKALLLKASKIFGADMVVNAKTMNISASLHREENAVKLMNEERERQRVGGGGGGGGGGPKKI
jgi:hypothetical protein